MLWIYGFVATHDMSPTGKGCAPTHQFLRLDCLKDSGARPVDCKFLFVPMGAA